MSWVIYMKYGDEEVEYYGWVDGIEYWVIGLFYDVVFVFFDGCFYVGYLRIKKVLMYICVMMVNRIIGMLWVFIRFFWY